MKMHHETSLDWKKVEFDFLYLPSTTVTEGNFFKKETQFKY